MTPLPYTGITKIDRVLTDAWRRRLSIRIKAIPVEPLFEGDDPWTQWSVTIRRPDRHPGTALSLYDRASYTHLIWHTRGRHTRFSGGWSYAWGRKGRQVHTRKELYRAIDAVSIGI